MRADESDYRTLVDESGTSVESPVVIPTTEIPTVVRLPACAPEMKVDEECTCRAAWCLSRSDVDRSLQIVESEKNCRLDLRACRSVVHPPPVEPGWSPVVVIAVGVAIVIVATAVGYGAGYLTADGRD